MGWYQISAKIIQVVGTQSGAGKSTIVMSLCRYFSGKGYRVAPFKAFNMSLNSVVIAEGTEIARSQWLQALSAGINPEREMTPILVKPERGGFQPIILGKSLGKMTYGDYSSYMEGNARDIVKEALRELSSRYDMIIAEGTGSAAEINLRERDVGNMFVSSIYGTPALLVSNIELGGVFASLYGSIILMDRPDLLKGFVINNFRGDPAVLKNGVEEIEIKTGKKSFGVIPHIENIALPGEDYYDYASDRHSSSRVVVVRLPFMENYSDLDPLAIHGIGFRYLDKDGSFSPAADDVIIIPGSKDVPSDLEFMKKSGIHKLLLRHASQGGRVLGICGGYQMLGRTINLRNSDGGVRRLKGLCLLNCTTDYKREKTVRPVYFRRFGNGGRYSAGYEIHYGMVTTKERPLFETRSGTEGSARGNIVGTNIHGVLEDNIFLRDFLGIRQKKAYSKLLKDEIERVSGVICSSLDLAGIEDILCLQSSRDGEDH